MLTYWSSFNDSSFRNLVKNLCTGLILATSFVLPFQNYAQAQNNHSLRKNQPRTLSRTQKTRTNPTLLQKGMASWYSTSRHNRHKTTAQGENFNPDDLTAAHPFLPFGTKLLIRSQRTGKSVIVKVNDRGPYTKNRIIDLSRSAAERIGLIKSGVGAVTVSVLNNDEVAQMPETNDDQNQ